MTGRTVRYGRSYRLGAMRASQAWDAHGVLTLASLMWRLFGSLEMRGMRRCVSCVYGK